MWITTAAQLAEKLPMTAEELAAVQSVADRYPMCITPYYLGLIDPNDPDDPIRKMAVPAPIEEEEGGSFDTSGEQSNTRVPGLQHKYLQTAMVLTTNRCAMYCRHCFRKRLVGLSNEELNKRVDEVVETGWRALCRMFTVGAYLTWAAPDAERDGRPAGRSRCPRARSGEVSRPWRTRASRHPSLG